MNKLLEDHERIRKLAKKLIKRWNDFELYGMPVTIKHIKGTNTELFLTDRGDLQYKFERDGRIDTWFLSVDMPGPSTLLLMAVDRIGADESDFDHALQVVHAARQPWFWWYQIFGGWLRRTQNELYKWTMSIGSPAQL